MMAPQTLLIAAMSLTSWAVRLKSKSGTGLVPQPVSLFMIHPVPMTNTPDVTLGHLQGQPSRFPAVWSNASDIIFPSLGLLANASETRISQPPVSRQLEYDRAVQNRQQAQQERVTKLKAAWRSARATRSGFLVAKDVPPLVFEGDTTAGWLAFSDIPLQPGTRNADIGGGKDDDSTLKLKTKKGVTNLVFDPFARSDAHNDKILDKIGANPTDTATSFSVLNVAERREDRLAHIQFVYDSIKYGGTAYFKAWPGDGSGKTTQAGENGLMFFQSNRGIDTYIAEIESIFGEGRAIVENDKALATVQKGQEAAVETRSGAVWTLDQTLRAQRAVAQ